MSAQWTDPPEYGSGFRLAVMTPVVKKLIIATAVVFVVQLLVPASPTVGGGLSEFEATLGVNPPRWKSVLLPVWQLVTYAFLHSPGSFFHILWNMLLLYFLGSALEGIVGGRRFLLFYLAAAVAGGLLQLAVSLLAGWDGIVLGASGAVLGVVIGMAVLQPRMTIIFIIIPMTLKTLAIIVVAMDVFGVLLEMRSGISGGVAHFAHLGGALFGFLAVKLGWVWKDPLAVVEERVAAQKAERAVDDRRRVDDLLEKISREGISSLTSAEKKFLKRASKR